MHPDLKQALCAP